MNQKGIAPLLIIIVIVVLVGGYFIYQNQTKTRQIACTLKEKICPDGTTVSRVGPNCEFEECPTSQPSPIPNEEAYSINKTTGWKIYSNDEFNFEIEYPADFQLGKSNNRSFHLSKVNAEDRQNSPPNIPYIPSNFIYILVIPDNLAAEVIYTYDPKENEILSSMKVGDTKSVKDIDPEFWTYKRLSDVNLDGVQAKVFENKRVWEGAQGSISKRIYLRKGKFLFIIEGLLGGDLFQGERQDIKISESQFSQILSTFRFLP